MPKVSTELTPEVINKAFIQDQVLAVRKNKYLAAQTDEKAVPPKKDDKKTQKKELKNLQQLLNKENLFLKKIIQRILIYFLFFKISSSTTRIYRINYIVKHIQRIYLIFLITISIFQVQCLFLTIKINSNYFIIQHYMLKREQVIGVRLIIIKSNNLKNYKMILKSKLKNLFHLLLLNDNILKNHLIILKMKEILLIISNQQEDHHFLLIH
ncbi:unnamed protein product [Paramecium sonneborni]|uniref:Transmembrane protein n=1 Tax=Paramecium sonneborni TaxID=65129 RepID=A0A8S1RAY7_9CILI|nr:unnamed protein product [Paramecium sonneborni]